MYLVELQHAQLDLLVLVLDLLGLGVRLLLVLLAATQQARQRVQRRLIGDAACRQRRAGFQLPPGKRQTLLLRGEACLGAESGVSGRQACLQQQL